MTDEKLRFKSALEIDGPVTESQIRLYEKTVDQVLDFRKALEEIASLPDVRSDECSVIAQRVLDKYRR